MSSELARGYLTAAYTVAEKFSTDKSTNNGAVLVDEEHQAIVAWGANHFPRNVAETPERLVRPTKYLYVAHAEDVSISNAARNGVRTEGLVMYCPWSACNECAKPIIESGIKRVVSHKKMMESSYNQWPDSIKIALEMFKEAGVEYDMWDGDIGGVEILLNGKSFRP